MIACIAETPFYRAHQRVGEDGAGAAHPVQRLLEFMVDEGMVDAIQVPSGMRAAWLAVVGCRYSL